MLSPYLKILAKWVRNLFSDDWQAMAPRLPCPRLLVWLLICLVIGKLILMSQNEILASYSPHDDLWQIRAAGRAYWGGDYSPDKLYHLPVFPIFIAIVRLFGLPLRLAFEIVYCGAASF